MTMMMNNKSPYNKHFPKFPYLFWFHLIPHASFLMVFVDIL